MKSREMILLDLKKLLAEKGFKDSVSHEILAEFESVEQREPRVSKIKGFTKDKCVVEAGNECLIVSSDSLNDALTDYIGERDGYYMDRARLGKELKAIGVKRKQIWKGKREYKKYYYTGIALKEETL